MSVISDIIEGGLEINDGIATANRIFLVTVPTTVAPHAKFWQARNTGGIPALNEQHPTVPRIVARTFAMSPMDRDPNIIKVDVGYAEPPAIETATEQGSQAPGKTVEVSIDTFTEGTLFDIDGNLMTLKYFAFTGLSGGNQVSQPGEFGEALGIGSLSVGQLTQNLEFQVERPTSTVRITEETDSIPKQFIIDGFVGSINSVEWSGFPPRTWLLRGIATTQTKKDRNRVTWVFTYNKRTWRAEGRVNNNGVVPGNASLENGIAFFRVYPEVDFKLTGQFF